MSESFVNPIFGERDGARDRAIEQLEGTGDADVDAVVASLRGLDDLPVAEHVAVFEQAHESLRRALAGAGEPVQAATRAEPCRLGACGSTPSWYAAAWLARASTPAS